ncbi:hypothetical protein [Streptomyces hokutonensis]|uniref:hypothetical protein n=1 Tax=Streptomyces hokutonensis TaxID=1306990 RepID=UPI003699BC8F
MSDQTPPRPAYRLPNSSALGAAVDTALNDAERAHEQLGRVMAVVTAAAVRDILTGCKPDAPFDAAAVELVEGEDGSLFPNGRYWTMAGDERTFTETVGLTEAGNGIHEMSGWTAYLDDDTRDVWRPLCGELPDRNGRPAYRVDLVRAAALLDEPEPGESRMVEVVVSANETDRYPALVDPSDQASDGYVKPWFDLGTVRQIAANTQADAARYGHGSIDTVHVIDGTVDGTRHAVVLLIAWMYLGGDSHEKATQVLQPNDDDRYAVGGHAWCWYALDDDLMPQIPFRPTDR